MSLRPDDRSGRARSSSKSGRERSRSRSNVRAPEAPEVPRSNYSYQPPSSSSAMPGSFSTGGSEPRYDERTPSQVGSTYYPPTTITGQSQYVPPASPLPYPVEGGYSDFPLHERPSYDPRQGQGYYAPPPSQPQRHPDDDLAYGSDSSKASKGAREPLSRHSSYSANYRYSPADNKSPAQKYQYAQTPEKVTYNARPQSTSGPQGIVHSSTSQGPPPPRQLNHTSNAQGVPYDSLPRTYAHPAYDNTMGNAQIVEMVPGSVRQDRHESSNIKAHRLSVNNEQSGLAAPRSPGLGPRMSRLSVSGNRPDIHAIGGGMPPPSPMLEAYHGTYQSLSPMPLALRLDDSDLNELPPLSPATTKTFERGHERHESKAHGTREKKRAIIYDGEEDAKAIAKALNHHTIDGLAICDVLPRLTHDQILDVRKEYKKQVKVQGKGVNLSKHIKTKITGNFGKAVYVTALGRWESEGYWANFWYQSHGSRRELLIESLMGRSNSDIRMIKDEFKDKRYANSLTRCMEKELKMDKFRTAVLMVLEERRQEEQDVYPMEYVHRDVDLLYRSIRAERGGESGMLEIIVRRSDAHLREVLKTYERMYGENFARVALKKSNNLVGEVIAHILNGVINKPARDALLLQHAIRDIAEKNKDDELRYELLVSRLVRLHWDKLHLMRVKKEYYEKYRTVLEDAIEDATKGDFREFMCELCELK